MKTERILLGLGLWACMAASVHGQMAAVYFEQQTVGVFDQQAGAGSEGNENRFRMKLVRVGDQVFVNFEAETVLTVKTPDKKLFQTAAGAIPERFRPAKSTHAFFPIRNPNAENEDTEVIGHMAFGNDGSIQVWASADLRDVWRQGDTRLRASSVTYSRD